MEDLEDQLKRVRAEEYQRRIQEKIRNLRKLIKKTELDMEKVIDVKDWPDDEIATHYYSE